ncbi:MAG: hypothetical protein GYB31_07380 [Bacteroidetes bacterium]|nr:hypothetical protein [Bacteroidota bacterium]
MKRKTFLLITAIIYVPFGIAMILMPETLYGLYGFELGKAGLVLGQVVGSAITGMGIINFVARKDASNSSAIMGILWGNLIYHVVDIMVVMPPTINGLVGSLTWSFVGLHVVLAIGFAYYLFKKS